jgi:triosephosphate isomerase
MPQLLVGTSTKMNLTSTETAGYLETLLPLLEAITGIERCHVFVLPPFTSIWVARQRLRGTRVAWGAQDVHPDDAGAHTGDISAPMLADLGCTYVECGHSERRRDHGETDELIARKVAAVLRHGMRPILCVGEPSPGPADAAGAFVLGQLKRDLAGVSAADLKRVVVAYEPVWAIGVGAAPAEPSHVVAVHMAIHRWLTARQERGLREEAGTCPEADAGHEVEAQGPRPHVIYGGSVDPDAARALLAEPAVDGLFVGRSALDPHRFASIVELAALTRRRGRGP